MVPGTVMNPALLEVYGTYSKAVQTVHNGI